GSESRDLGAFWIGNRAFGDIGLQLGLRHDNNRVDVDATAIGPGREFGTTSASASLEWKAGNDLHLAFALARAQRSPTAEGPYADGVHVATAGVERGAPRLKAETANRAELGAHWHAGALTLGASLYRVAYADFIYLARTGEEVDGLPMQQWMQADARFSGGEA